MGDNIDNHDAGLDEEYKEEFDEDSEERIKEYWQPEYMKAAQRGDIEQLKKCLERRIDKDEPDKNSKEKKWTAIIWACDKGHVDAVRLLLEHGCANIYIPKSEPNSPEKKPGGAIFDGSPEKASDAKLVQRSVNTNARATPLQWACFKRNLHCVYLLLKQGVDIYEADSFGNNAIHQAVAGDSPEVFEALLQYGVRIDSKNLRGHGVRDVCTNSKIMKLIDDYENTKQCPDTKRTFQPGEIKYLCAVHGKFYSEEASQLYWIYEDKDSTIKEKPERRSNIAQKYILYIEDQLNEQLQKYDYPALHELLQKIEDEEIHVEVKLLEKAVVHRQKLKTQNQINDTIDSLARIDDYKTILKSKRVLEETVEEAKKNEVALDADILERIDTQLGRLQYERDLRFENDNPKINTCSNEDVEKITELKNRAVELGIAEDYAEETERMLDKMKRNLKAKEIYKNFTEYPVREWYPPLYYLDHKTKKAMDPATRKPMDPKLLIPPKPKRGRKTPKFVLPQWATETKELQSQIQQLEELLSQRDELLFDDEFMNQTDEQLKRLKYELRFRKLWDQEEIWRQEKMKGRKK